MTPRANEAEEQGRRVSARRDIAWVAAISVAAAVICLRFDVSEALMRWTRPHERLQLDELPAVFLVIATCLIWFSSRRYFEARRHLALRRTIENRLADALAENQRLAQQYMDMQEYERKALARDLHDELGQYLNVIKLDAVSLRDASPHALASVGAVARAMIENVDRLYAVVGSLIRQLRPVGFDDLGVAAALHHCIDEWRARLPGIDIVFHVDSNCGELEEIRALALFRLVQEALTNVARHSQATRVEIRITERASNGQARIVEVSIVDNGCGMNLDVPRSGLGLVGMRERVAAFGGSLRLTSGPGRGVAIHAALPAATSTGHRA